MSPSALPYGFNPLPPPKRGETAPSVRGDFDKSLIDVSIHSPRRSEGRPVAGPRFNPLPPPKQCLATWMMCSGGFNPLPPPKRGETELASARL